MDDDVMQSSTDRYALSQAYRWRAERDQARQELQEIQARLMPEGMEWLLDVWPKWSNGDYCKFGDWWTAECYGEFEPKQLRKLSIYTPEQLDEFGQGNGKDYGYEWDFFRPSYVTYHPVKVEPPAPKVLAADGEPLLDGDEVWRVKDGSGPYHVQEVRDGVSVCVGETHCEFRPDELTHRAPVIAADGRLLREGETVWDANGDELVIGALEDGGRTVTCRYADIGDGIPTHGMWSPSDLTHQRPVLGADGVPIKKGDTVYMLNDDRPYTVKKVETNRVSVNAGEGAYDVWKAPTYLTHQRPVLDVNGVPIHEGDEVYGTVEGGPFIVTEVSDKGSVFVDAFHDTGMHGSMLTHTKPEPPDSWERIEEDAGCTATKYNERRGTIFTTKQQVARDLVRRCRALAERERGE